MEESQLQTERSLPSPIIVKDTPHTGKSIKVFVISMLPVLG